MLYLVIFFILLVFYTVLFWIDLKVSLDYIRNDQDEWIVLSFYTLDGFFRYVHEIPLVSTKEDKVKFKLVKGQKNREMRTGKKNKGRLTPLDYYRKYISAKTYFGDHSDMIVSIRKYLNKKNIPVELFIKVKQGTGDAAQTGLICGFLWAAAGILTTYLIRYLKVIRNEISIVPRFDKSIFNVDAYCIFHARLVHIIVVLIKIYYSKYRIRMKSKKTIGGEISG